MLWAVLSVVLVLGVAVCMHKWLKNKELDDIPGPKGFYLIGNSFEFLMDPVKVFYYFRTLGNKYKNLYKINVGTMKFVVIYNPEDVEVLISGTRHNSKGYIYKFLESWLKEGLLVSDGTKWQNRRKILTPTFHFNILRHFHNILEESSKKLVEQLLPEVDKPKTDVFAFITDYTLNSICVTCSPPLPAKWFWIREKIHGGCIYDEVKRKTITETAMGTKMDPETSDFGRRYKNGIHTLGNILVHRAQRFWLHSNWLFSLSNVGRQHNKILRLLSSFRDSVIDKRRESSSFQNVVLDDASDAFFDSNHDSFTFGKRRLAMLDLLLQAEREGKIDAKGIGEEVDTFMFEGHDTTATALQFTMLLLANNLECQNKIVEECKQIFGSSTQAATMSDLGQMKYLECCIKESLRLYPPVYFVMRRINQPLKLKNYEVPVGRDCAVMIYDLHRRSDQFVEPLKFQPERFLEEKPTWHPFSYIPFSAGPRNCIGQKFAMMEMKLALSAVLRRYKLLPVTRPQDLVFVTDFMLRSKYPIYVKFEKRD